MMYFQQAELKAKKQQGSALMLALFVIIVLILLGSALVKVLSSSNETIAQEVIGTRALMAANAGMQAELSRLFPLSVDPLIPNPVGACNANSLYDLSNQPGLYHCRAEVSCMLYSTVDTVNYYRLTSTGECGSSDIDSESIGVVRSSRTLQVEARSL